MLSIFTHRRLFFITKFPYFLLNTNVSFAKIFSCRITMHCDARGHFENITSVLDYVCVIESKIVLLYTNKHEISNGVRRRCAEGWEKTRENDFKRYIGKCTV